MRARPLTVPAAAARSASASAARSSSASACSTRTRAGSVRRTPRPARSSSAHAGLALEHRELLRDGRRRELQGVGDRGDRPAIVQLAQQAQAAEIEHCEATLPILASVIGVDPDAFAGHDARHALLRDPPLPRLGRHVRRHGGLRQARLRRRRDRRHAARRPLRARGGAAVGADPRGGRHARDPRAGPPRRRRRPRPRRRAATPSRPAATSPRSSASTPRCCRCCSTRSRRSSPSRRSPSAASGPTRGGWPRWDWRRAASRSSSPARGRARSTRSASRSGSAPRSSTAPTSSSARASPGACARGCSRRSSAPARRCR